MSANDSDRPLVIGGERIARGERRTVSIPAGRLPSSIDAMLPVHVLHGAEPGPSLFVTAGIHGDEINGVQVIQRLLRIKTIERLRGTLIAVPVVNVHGFATHSRYLPDRRDLNRSFPGSEHGSLAARLASTLLQEVVANASFGIDLHAGAKHRSNLPQVRISADDERAREAALRFGVPVVHQSEVRPGSLRAVALERGVPLMLYEGGEALRIDEWAIRAGLRGVLSTMEYLGMLTLPQRPKPPPPVMTTESKWIRAPRGGVFRARVRLGATIDEGDALAQISDVFGGDHDVVRAPCSGMVIGISHLAVVNEGDALLHLAWSPDARCHLEASG